MLLESGVSFHGNGIIVGTFWNLSHIFQLFSDVEQPSMHVSMLKYK